MELIIGGKAQGKRNYATSLSNHIIIDNLQDIIYTTMKSGENPQKKIQSILENTPDCIIICNEIGCGLVPVDAFEREYRDIVGKICCELAKKADRVHRVMGGIGVVIKQ